MKKRREFLEAASLVALLFALAGCASAPVTPAQTEIRDVIKSGVLDPAHVVTAADKHRIALALTHAGDAIGAAEEARAEAEKRAEKSAAWASRGKWLFGGILAAAFLFFLGAGVYVARKFI